MNNDETDCLPHVKPAPLSGWQPIETAPKHVQLLVLRRDGVMHVANVDGFQEKYGILFADFGDASCTFLFPIGGNYEADDTPTHWMPLPAPPVADAVLREAGE